MVAGITKKCLGGNTKKSTWFKTEGATWASRSMVWEWECLFSENKKNTVATAGVSYK